MRKLSVTPEINALIDAGAPVAFGVSGGKDGETAVFEVLDYLDSRGHAVRES